MNGPTVRTITDDELGAYLDVVRTAFLSPPFSPEAVEARRGYYEVDRCLGAYDGGGRLCGVARAFATPFTVPGGEVAAGAVSAVGVLPTHTRQGHLTRLMHTQLADIAERGEPVAVLIAAEYPIYGRFGYGPAAEAVTLRIDAAHATWRDGPTGSVEIVDASTYAKHVHDLYDRARRTIPGHIGAPAERWRYEAGAVEGHDEEDEARRTATRVLWRDERGEPQAAASYAAEESWVHNRPSNKVATRTFVATSDQAGLEMLRYLTAIDWVSQVQVGLRPVDDATPLALVDGRTGRLDDRSDHTWARLLDVPAALAARRYATTGSLVVEVDDPLGFAHGRFRLDGAPDGAECAPSTDEPDLAMSAGALGAAYLGGQPWARLAAAGWVDEHRPGAVAEATALFTTPRAPWGSLTF
ncbi:MAG TPA: GNAT family N-acetyltransferase [Acidimicrobiales bacterium]|nr:GNAT family N-acetyltransferase [Acidimicrobiales bacterium]